MIINLVIIQINWRSIGLALPRDLAFLIYLTRNIKPVHPANFLDLKWPSRKMLEDKPPKNVLSGKIFKNRFL